MQFLPWQLAAAYLLDLVVGDPQTAMHPIRWIGGVITVLEGKIYPNSSRAALQTLAGVVLWAGVMAVVVIVTWLVLTVAGLLHSMLASAVAIWLAYTTLATRSLHKESRKVAKALCHGDLTGAREALSYLVSRETDQLSEEEILRALVETVAENLADGVVAPLFYLSLGGPVLAMAYKAVSTMDSMVGYRNQRYRYFGACAARADDVANWVPARLTGWLLVVAAAWWRLDWRHARRIMLRDGRKHKSPNAGISEAAAAGALEVRLGGPSTYFGEVMVKDYLGDPHRPLSLQSYDGIVRLLYTVSLLALLPACVVRWLV